MPDWWNWPSAFIGLGIGTLLGLTGHFILIIFIDD